MTMPSHSFVAFARRGALALFPLVGLVGCGDDSETGSTGGGGSASTSSSTGGDTSTSSASSATSGATTTSTGDTTSAGGAGAGGGDGTGGVGIGGEAGTGGQGDGAGGAAPPDPVWALPSCDAVDSAIVTFTSDDNATIAPRTSSITEPTTAPDLVAMRAADTLLAFQGASVLRSIDAGCSWSAFGVLPARVRHAPIAAPGNRAYVETSDEGDGGRIVRIEGDEILPAATLDEGTQALGVDPVDPDHLRYVLFGGTIEESTDGGATFAPIGETAPSFCLGGAFDPSDLDRLLCGGIPAQVTFDGGGTWETVETRGSSYAALQSFAHGPAGSDVVWAAGFDYGDDPGGDAVARLWRSEDGGHSFDTVVADRDVATGDASVVDLHGLDPLLAPPGSVDSVYFIHSRSPSSDDPVGIYVYRYDHASGEVTAKRQPMADFDRYDARAVFNPTHPEIMYVGLGYEGPIQ